MSTSIFALLLLASGFAVYYAHYPYWHNYPYHDWWYTWRIGAVCLWAFSGFLLLVSIILCSVSASRDRRAERVETPQQQQSSNYQMNVAPPAQAPSY